MKFGVSALLCLYSIVSSMTLRKIRQMEINKQFKVFYFKRLFFFLCANHGL